MLPLGIDTSSTASKVVQVTALVLARVVAIAVVRSRVASPLSGAVVLVVAAMVTFGLKDLLASGSRSAWSTSEGINLRAGFIAGCSHEVSSRVGKCECVFEHVSKVPPYDTPTGFMGMVTS